MALKPNYRSKFWTTSKDEICKVDFKCNCCGEYNKFDFNYNITYYLPNSKTVYNIDFIKSKMNEINNTSLIFNQVLFN